MDRLCCPQDLQARQRSTQQALAQVQRPQQRLLDAYLAGIVHLAELDRKRQELLRRAESLVAERRHLDALAPQHRDLQALATSIAAFCAQVHAGLLAQPSPNGAPRSNFYCSPTA